MARTRRATFVLGLVVVGSLAAAPALAANADVSIAGKAFEPATITVAQGDTVTWTVTESIGEPHSVTSGTPQAQDGRFDSGFTLQDNGQTFEVTFDQPGEYAYFCIVHPIEMTGTVIVTAAGAGSPAPTAAPASEAPAASEAPPATEGPAEPPAGEGDGPVPVEQRALAGGILVVAIALMFAAGLLWRRLNPA